MWLIILLILVGCSQHDDNEKQVPVVNVPLKRGERPRRMVSEPVRAEEEQDEDDDVCGTPQSPPTKQDRKCQQVQARIDRISRLKRSGKSLAEIKKEMDVLSKERLMVNYNDQDPLED